MADLSATGFTLDAAPGAEPGTTVLTIDDVDSVQCLHMPNHEALALAAKLMVAATGESNDRPARRTRIDGTGRA